MSPATTPPDYGLLDFLFQYLTDERKSLLREVAANRTRHITVVLDDVFHPHNVSAVLRSCDCFGIQDVHIVENKYSWDRHPHVERGSTRWLTLHRYRKGADNTADCFGSLKAKGYLIAAATPHSDTTIDDIPIDRPLAFVFGAEKDGISAETQHHADVLCKIPMYGFSESFNVSVAAALTLHAMRRRLANSTVAWGLSNDEKAALFIEWSKNSLKHYDKFVRAYHASINDSSRSSQVNN